MCFSPFSGCFSSFSVGDGFDLYFAGSFVGPWAAPVLIRGFLILFYGFWPGQSGGGGGGSGGLWVEKGFKVQAELSWVKVGLAGNNGRVWHGKVGNCGE